MSWAHVEDRIVVARKRYLCVLCGQRILPGTQYLSRFGFDDDGPIHSRMHIDCEALTRDWDSMDWETYMTGEGEWPDHTEKAEGMMSEATAKCPKCGYEGIVLTHMLNSDLRLIADAQEHKITQLRKEREDARAAAMWLRIVLTNMTHDEQMAGVYERWPWLTGEYNDIETQYGTFAISRRATWGFSVVRAKHDCRCRYKPVKKGDYVVVEHRKRPHCPSLIACGWGDHVATYGLDGIEIQIAAKAGGDDA